MRAAVLLVSALAIAVAFPPASAGCEELQVMPFVLVPLHTPEGTFYAYYDGGCDPTCHGAEWLVFEETNGEPGLQYGAFFGHRAEERCTPSGAWDTVVA